MNRVSLLSSAAAPTLPARTRIAGVSHTSDDPVRSDLGGRTEPIHHWVRAIASSHGDHLAVCDKGRTLTYAELDACANALAHRLRELGVQPGARVGLCHERSAVTSIGALATLKAGGAYVGLDPAYPEARLDYMLHDADVAVILTQPSMTTRLKSAGAPVIDLDSFVVATRGADQPPDELATTADVAYVIYTSGSTGEPKGVELSHQNLISLVAWHHDAFGVRETDRASVLANPAFDASAWEVWPYLTAGASLHVPDHATARAPRLLREWLVDSGITITFVPTPMAETLLDLDWPPDGALRFVLTGGDVLHRRPPPTTPFTLVNNYGVTEATVVSTSGPVSPDVVAGRTPSIGRAITGTRLYVLDDNRRPVQPGDAGELFIGGDGVAVGYLNRPAETADRFVPDCFTTEPGARLYRTGDRVRIGLEGEVHFLGRLDSQVQIRGLRVELEEVAAALMTHPAVGRCVIFASEDDHGDHRLVAYMVATNAAIPDRAELREHLATWLPQCMIPTVFIEMDALPVTANGKLDRNALPRAERALVGGERRSAGTTSVETVVIAILEELLGLNGIDKDDNFFELGGHSLMGAQVVVRLEARFDLEVDLLTIFDNPTAASIAAVIEQDLQDDEEFERVGSTTPEGPTAPR
jgi:amino acid adenylation domain-containing protein